MKRPPFDPTFAQGGLFDQPAEVNAKKASLTNEAPRPLQVSEAAQLVGEQMAALGKLSIQGEVSGYRGANNSGHLYFSIKDAQCVLPCVIWKSKASSVKIPLAEGLQVVVEGRFNYYAEGGKLSFIVDSIRATGQGDLDAKFRLLCAELKELGYFEESRKRALPMLPRGIAIVTSASGAALQDCLAVAARKFPSVAITVIDVVVQGASAAAAVSNAIHLVDLAARRMGIDVILVTRGGGSREDLDAFNHRLIADAVYNCTTPVVAAIGHESDTSVIELVADVRASTPTAAMNRILPDARSCANNWTMPTRPCVNRSCNSARPNRARLRRFQVVHACVIRRNFCCCHGPSWRKYARNCQQQCWRALTARVEQRLNFPAAWKPFLPPQHLAVHKPRRTPRVSVWTCP